MAIARQTTASKIKPLTQAITRKVTLGATVVAGEVIALQSDGKWDPANTTSAAVVNPIIAVQGGGDGDVVDGVRWGPVECVTGGTPGAVCYASDTAGEPAESAGTNLGIVGYVESATIIFVNPAVAEA